MHAALLGEAVGHHEGEDLVLGEDAASNQGQHAAVALAVHVGEAVSHHEVGERSGVATEGRGGHQGEQGVGVAELLGHQEGGDLGLLELAGGEEGQSGVAAELAEHAEGQEVVQVQGLGGGGGDKGGESDGLHC